MSKMMGKKIFIIIRSTILFIRNANTPTILKVHLFMFYDTVESC